MDLLAGINVFRPSGAGWNFCWYVVPWLPPWAKVFRPLWGLEDKAAGTTRRPSGPASIHTKRLPKAIQCILSNYRGARVGGIPEQAIPAVLTRLADAATRAGHMPPATPNPAKVYLQLAAALEQLDITPEGE